MSTDNEQNKVEQLAAELAKANREIDTLKREKRRVGLSFHRIPETGHDISRLWNGDFPYLQKLPDNCLEKPLADATFNSDANTVLIEADNLAALMAMQLTHKGKIDVIYIDPPYNTGKNDFIYNDARKSSIKDVEGVSASDYESNLDGKARMVGKDDPERHSLWLSFMERRLWLAKELLSPSGVIYISIDDNEQARLKVLMDSIFGESNFLANIVWEKTYSTKNNTKAFSSTHEYLIVYKKTDLFEMNLLPRSNKNDSLYRLDDKDGKGLYRGDNVLSPSFVKNNVYAIVNPNTGEEFYPTEGSSWRWSLEKFQSLIIDGYVFWGKDGKGRPQRKRYLSEAGDIVPQTLWKYQDVGHTDAANKFLQSIMGNKIFDYPKPTDLIKQILRLHPDKNTLVLDFFAGSGTTAHAVAELNKEDGGSRQCILVTHGDEDGKNIAEDVTAERMKRVLSGNNWADGKEHDALTGSLYYYKLLFAPNTTNPLTAMETMQTRFTGLAALEQGAHVALENKSNYTVLMNSKKIVVVWKNEDALLDEPAAEFYPLLKLLKDEHTGKSLIVYTPSTSSSSSDEYGVERYGWTNYSFPMEYLNSHASLLERMKRNKTMLKPYADESDVEEFEEAIESLTNDYNPNVNNDETSEENEGNN